MHPTPKSRNLHMKQYLSHLTALIVFLFGLLQTDSAFAVLINIDFDQAIPERRPSDEFGAASGQAGVWNQIRRGTTSNLLDINDNATSAAITVTAFSSAGQAFFPPPGHQ